MINKKLMEEYEAANTAAIVAREKVANVFVTLSLQDKIEAALQFRSEIVEFLGQDIYYNGPDDGPDDVRTSLYDDFYWSRYETKTIDDLIDWTLDEMPEDFEGNEAEYLLTSDTSRARIVRHMLERNIGTARHDW